MLVTKVCPPLRWCGSQRVEQPGLERVEGGGGPLIGSLLTSYSEAKPAFPEQVPLPGEGHTPLWNLSISPPF